MPVYTHNWGDHSTIYINRKEGFCKLNIYDEDGRRTAELYDMIVYPEYRGHGMGTTLLTIAILQAKAAYCDFVIMWPVKEGWIQAWYKRHGFAEDYRFRNYEGTPGWSKALKVL